MIEGGHEPRTVLLLGNYLPSLDVARSLSEAGWRVIAGEGGEYSPARYSRAVSEVWAHPPIADIDAFFAALERFTEERPDVTTIVPMRPPYVEHLTRHAARLPHDVVLAAADPDVVARCLDKERMHALAKEAGVPLREIRVATDIDGLREAAAACGYPCVVRPRTDAGSRLPGRRKAFIADDADALVRGLPAWPAGHDALVVQRYVDGPRHNIFFAAAHGRIISSLETRIDRTDRFDGTGVAVDGISVEPDERLMDATAALVKATGYHGTGFAQFLVPVEGEPHFLELNPRLAGSTAIARHCGLDLAVAAVQLAHGADWHPDASLARIGERYVWTSRELFALASGVLGREVGGADSLRWAGRALRAAIRADVHLSWSLRDPLPTLMIYAHLLTLGPWRRSRRAGTSD